MRRLMFVIAIACSSGLFAQPPRQTQQDDYSQYELLAPETASFKILYDVSSTTSGATSYFNPIRKGSEASDEAVYDMMTGQPLKFDQVTGTFPTAATRSSNRLAEGHVFIDELGPPRNLFSAQVLT